MNFVELHAQERRLKRDIKQAIDAIMARNPRYIIGYSDDMLGIKVYVLDATNAMHPGYDEMVYDRDLCYYGVLGVEAVVHGLIRKYNGTPYRIC